MGEKIREASKIFFISDISDAPLTLTYLGLLRLGHPCISTSPFQGETLIKRFTLKHRSGLTGALYAGIGNTIHVVEKSKSFEFIFDTNTPKEFIRSSVAKAYEVARGSVKSYILFAYAPVGSWIDPVEKCQQKPPAEVYPIPIPGDIDKCAPRQIGDTVECVNQHGVGYIATAVSPVYLYVIAGYGLTIVPRRG